uniref:Secreted protein n=1 Tax=Trichobilharzia regenti TaxID=157069 RepID=A0AA85JRG2_TRIRE|nr:unnamed protein product [Trichobilharzia regenti]
MHATFVSALVFSLIVGLVNANPIPNSNNDGDNGESDALAKLILQDLKNSHSKTKQQHDGPGQSGTYNKRFLDILGKIVGAISGLFGK